MFKYEFSISKSVKYLIPANSKKLILNNPYLEVPLIEFLSTSIPTRKVLQTLKPRNDDILTNISTLYISSHNACNEQYNASMSVQHPF